MVRDRQKMTSASEIRRPGPSPPPPLSHSTKMAPYIRLEDPPIVIRAHPPSPGWRHFWMAPYIVQGYLKLYCTWMLFRNAKGCACWKSPPKPREFSLLERIFFFDFFWFKKLKKIMEVFKMNRNDRRNCFKMYKFGFQTFFSDFTFVFELDGKGKCFGNQGDISRFSSFSSRLLGAIEKWRQPGGRGRGGKKLTP